MPSDRTLVVERFRDEIGDWRLCVLSPYGGRVHAAWALALSARIRDVFGLEADAIWSDDGIIVHLPDADDPPGAELVLVEPDEAEDLVVAELGASALFGARFRENAARSLLIPRAYPGRRTPLWQQRLKAQSLLEVARRYPQFPVILETYRECLRDVLDVPGLTDLLRRLHTRELALVEVETQTASPFASSLLFDYVATYMYEGDTPAAERRAVALALDRDLLRELLGQEELRDLIDPGALEQVEDDLQHRSEQLRARDADALHDVLRRVGDLTPDEAAQRGEPPAEARRLAARGSRTSAAPCAPASAARSAGSRPRTPGCTATPSASCRPAACPRSSSADVPDAMLQLVRRFARTHGPFETGEVRARYGVDVGPGARRAGAGRRARARRAAAAGHAARVVRPGRAPPPAARVAGGAAQGDRAGRPGDPGALRARLAGRRPLRAAPGAGVGPAARRAGPAAGPAAARPSCGSRTCCRAALGAYSPALARRALRQRRGRLGRRGAAGRALGARRAVLPRRRAPARPAAGPRERPEGATHDAAARAPGPRRLLLRRPAASSTPSSPPTSCARRSGTSSGRARSTNDAFAPLRSRARSPGRRRARGARAPAPRRPSGRFRRRARGAPPLQGRWSLADDRLPRRAATRTHGGAPGPSCSSSATAS